MSWQTERKCRQEIVDAHRNLYDLGFSVANDGNTSIRMDKNRILITPMGLDKARLEPDQLSVIDTTGKPLSGSYPPSSEIAVHLTIYRVRPDVRAVIHSHPPYCIACSLAGIHLDRYVLPEVVLTLGKVPTADYATTGTEEAGKVLEDLVRHHDAIILDRHGIVTVGENLRKAFTRLERAEHTAKIIALASTMGKVTPLPQDEIQRLLQMSGRPLESKNDSSEVSGPDAQDENLIDRITKEVVEALAAGERSH